MSETTATTLINAFAAIPVYYWMLRCIQSPQVPNWSRQFWSVVAVACPVAATSLIVRHPEHEFTTGGFIIGMFLAAVFQPDSHEA